ncbi:MAG: hypothetical protein LC808_34590, partial [Actinobacteria bacterium]|nr:hypothetical protein [Actinomycetota bacterium]
MRVCFHTAGRWEELNALLGAALEQAPQQRKAFLDEQCGENVQLRTEIERLLAAHDDCSSFLERPAVHELLASDTTHREVATRLTPGTLVGPYEIVAFLGAGGMGEVYRARDPRLKREVAIKLISATLAGDDDRLRR